MIIPRSDFLRFWSPALICLLCFCFAMGMMSVFSIFVNPVVKDFGVSVATVTTAPIFLLLAPAFVGPLIGAQADRISIKILMLIGVTTFTFSLYAISVSSTIVQAGFGFFGFSIGLVMCGPIVINSLLVKIYQRDSGRALAISAMGMSAASMALPIWVAYLMQDSTWRDALATMAGVIFFVLSLLIIFGIPASSKPIVRRGASSVNEQESNTQNNAETKTEDKLDSSIYRQPAFWLIGFGVAFALNAALIFGVCYADHLRVQGFELKQAAWMLSVGGVGGLFGKSIVASVVDRLADKVKYIAAGAIVIKLAGLALLMMGASFNTIILSALLIGLGGGAFIPMHPILNSCYFGQSVIGRVTGAQMPLFLPLGIIGAPLAGYSFDQLGHYNWAIYSLAFLLFVAVCLLLRLPAPPSEKFGSVVSD